MSMTVGVRAPPTASHEDTEIGAPPTMTKPAPFSGSPGSRPMTWVPSSGFWRRPLQRPVPASLIARGSIRVEGFSPSMLAQLVTTTGAPPTQR